MARQKSALRPGLTELDFRSMTSIREALGDEKAIRAEYSRMRSIIRKRVERLGSAGETKNWMHRTFGNVAENLPTAKGMSTRDMMMRMAPMARALSGSYQTTLKEIRKSRKKAIQTISQEAKQSGQAKEAVDLGQMTDAEYEKYKILMGMIENVIGRQVAYSKGLIGSVVETMSDRKPGESIRDLAKRAISIMELSEQKKRDAKHSLEYRWTTKGKTKVAWKNRRK